MYSISRLAKLFGLSRSTLLYYDNIGVLSPSERSRANYRLYSETDKQRLETIVTLRQTGLSLEEIKKVLAVQADTLSTVLNKRLAALNQEITALRKQQQVIVSLLKLPTTKDTRIMTKKKWVAILRNAGLDDAAMLEWHKAFESMAPEAHQDFLESLGMAADEIYGIREGSK